MVAAIGLLLICALAPNWTVQNQPPNEKPSGILVVKNGWKKAPSGGAVSLEGMQLPGPPPVATGGPGAPVTDGYDYSATIMNAGAKAIKGLVWDYVVAMPDEPESVTHHVFYTHINVSTGKKKEIYKFATATPTRSISAGKQRTRLTEQVIVKAVEYADGSVWKIQE
jgi:hypothetical protein